MAVCLVSLCGFLFVGCGNSNIENQEKQVEMALHVVTVDYTECGFNGSISQYKVTPTVYVVVDNPTDYDFNYASQTFKVVSDNLAFKGGLCAGTQLFIDDTYTTITSQSHSVDILAIQVEFNDNFTVDYKSESYFANAGWQESELDKTTFSVYMADKLVGSFKIKTFVTKGHTDGSICVEVEKTLFTGDTKFAWSCGRTDLITGSEEDMQQSLELLDKKYKGWEIYPGHGKPGKI